MISGFIQPKNFILILLFSGLFHSCRYQDAKQNNSVYTTSETLVSETPAKLEQEKTAKITNEGLKLIQSTDSVLIAPKSPSNNKYSAYLSSSSKGYIDKQGDSMYDNPADNIFEVLIDRKPDKTDRVWINYKLKGISHHSGITCSINDRMSFGGYLVQTDTTLVRQRVEINPEWLKKGRNQIRFGLPTEVNVGCQISDLAIEIEQQSESNQLLVINQNRKTYNGKAYIHGFVKHDKRAVVTVDGKLAKLRDNEFEALIQPDSDSIIIQAKVDESIITKTIRFSEDINADFTIQPQEIAADNTSLFKKDKNNRLKSALATLEASGKELLAKKILKLTDLRNLDLPSLDLGMFNVTDQKRGVRFLPHGEHFSGSGASVAIKYDKTLIPDGYTEDDIRTFYFDPLNRHWVALERDTLNREQSVVVSKTTHFTDMINGVITTPESPETQGFAPTMMNDVQIADPASKIGLISPPTANNQGSANLSYSLELPPARNGMSPDLTISYNSDAGSGWLGEGWDLNIPSITVDTRWGVPRYDSIYQTETYIMDGMMLATVLSVNKTDTIGVPSVGHKGTLYERLAGEIQFHPVAENNFDLITRVGNSPDNYFWKVVTKEGLIYTFGQKDFSAVQEGWVNTFNYIKTDTKNKKLKYQKVISEWKLSSIEDQFGNFCRYYYNKNETAIRNSEFVKASEIRLKRIEIGRLRKASESDTVYQIIDFTSNTQKNKTQSSAKYGFLTINNSKLLDKINVFILNPNGQQDSVRSYHFNYKAGEFSTELLDKICMYNGQFNQNCHTFEYYNTINENYYAQEESIIVPKSNLLPALGGVNTDAKSFSLYVGLNSGSKIVKAEAEVGYNYTHSNTYSDSKVLLTDINGDGLPDKIFKDKYGDNEYLCFYPNLGDGLFGNDSIRTDYTGNFSYTHSYSNSNGWSGIAQIDKIKTSINGGMDKTKTTSNTKSYMADVNSDGLIDIIDNGTVYFNYISSYTANNIAIPSFSTNSGLTPRPVLNIKTPKAKADAIKLSDKFNAAPDPVESPTLTPTLIELSEKPIQRDSVIVTAEMLDNYAQIPMQDMVRVWEAPRPGVVSVSSILKYLGNINMPDVDGIHYAIQTEGVEKFCDSIIPGDSNFERDTLIENIEVFEGQRIFFRLQSGTNFFSNSLEDVVIWNQIIKYTDIDRGHSLPPDMDGYELETYNSVEGNFVSKETDNVIDSLENGFAFIDGFFHKPETKDSVFFKIFVSSDSIYSVDSTAIELIADTITGLFDTVTVKYKKWIENEYYIPKILIAEMKFGQEDTTIQSMNIGDYGVDVNLGCKLYYRFELSSHTNIQWDKIICKPTITYQRYGNDSDTTMYAGVKYNIFEHKYNVNSGNVISVPSNTPSFGVNTPWYNKEFQCNIDINSTRQINTNYTLVLYSGYNNVVVQNFHGTIINNNVNDNFTIDVLEAGNYYFAVYINDTINSEKVTSECNMPLQNSTSDFTPHVYCKQPESRNLFGHMWRGWGQFQYNANAGRYAKTIEEDSLFLPSDTSQQTISNNLGIEKMCMFKLSHLPYNNGYFWTGTNDHLFMRGDTICTGRLNVVEMPQIISMDVLDNIAISGNVLSQAVVQMGPMSTQNITQSLSGEKYEIKTAPVLSSVSESTTFWGGATAKIGSYKVGVNGSFSDSESKVTSSFMDMNGDGFPDYITDTKIEYTNPSGGLDGEIDCIIGEITNSHSHTFGFGGAYNKAQAVSTDGTNSSNGSNILSINLSKNMVDVSSVNINYQHSEGVNSYIDINGDGLPDKLFIKNNKVNVSLNTGYGFSTSVDWGFAKISKVKSLSGTVPVSVSLMKGPLMNVFKKYGGNVFDWVKKLNIGVNFGINGVLTTNYQLFGFYDMNSDGLQDKIFKSNETDNYAIEFNTGNGFMEAMDMEEIEQFNKSASLGISSNLSVNIKIKIFWGLNLALGASGSLSTATDYNLSQMMDIDGDGYADVLKADFINHGELKVKRSLIGTTNKLKAVCNPLGGSFELGYEKTKSSYNHPGGKWVVKNIILHDGIDDDGSNLIKRFKYYSGNYDRYEREFLGYAEVITENINTGVAGQPVYRKLKQMFDNANYYTRGALLESELIAVDGAVEKKKSASANTYHTYSVSRIANGSKNDISKGKYCLYAVDPAIELTKENMFLKQYIIYSPVKYNKKSKYEIIEGNNDSIVTSETFTDYYTGTGTHGEISTFKYSDKTNLGTNGTGDCNYLTTIEYLRDKPYMSLFALPVSVKVTDRNKTKVYRHTLAEWYDDYAGLLKEVRQINGAGDTSKVTLGYDRWGNLSQKELPAKNQADRMWFKYEYDNHYHLFPVKVSDKLGYSSSLSNYDYRYGIPLKSIDKNGNSSSTTLDNLGRISTITGPNEYNAGSPGNHTIKFEYYPHNITRNQDGSIINPAYAITKHFDPQHLNDSIVTVNFVDGFGRSIQVKKDASINGQSKMTVSGRVRYDAFGREVESYYPTMDVLSNQTVFNRTPSNYKTTYIYDALDRITKTILPDNTSTSAAYTLDVDNKLLVTTVTDALLNDQITYTNGSGLTVKTVQFKDKNTPYVTSFQYDAVNQPVETRDAAGKTTTYKYDLAGRRIEQTHPASGKTTFEYDPAGNLISKQTANLAKTNKKIQYFYKYNRLDSIVYPFHPENNVRYTYGSATDASGRNRKGRIVTLEDGSGVQEFSYGKMGELTQTKRSLVIPNHTMATYTTSWQYDSWNRLLNMTFPDGEIVNYSYDTGGQLSGITASKDSANFTYLDKILYDEFEQRSYIKYGNGAETNYTYKPDNRLLNNLKVNSGGIQMMNNTYSYDALQNITQILNNGSTANTIGGGISYNYHYDKLNRLDSASGEFTGYNGKKAKYTLSMAYDNMHNITRKKQDMVQSGLKFEGILHAGEELNYTINAENCQQIRNIAQSSYRQASPATAAYQTGIPGGVELKHKTEEYGYDANGNLLYVHRGVQTSDSTMQVNHTRKMLWDEENRLQAVSDNGFVSNYYYDASGERTVKLSGASQGVYVNGALNSATTQTNRFTAYINPYLVLNSGGYYSKHIYAGTQRIVSKLGSSEIFHSAPTFSSLPSGKLTGLTATVKARYDSLGVAYHGSPQGTNGFETSAAGKITTPQLYFYHPDHLGSSSLITDNNGLLVQHLQYLPFGEVFIDERKGSWHTPFTFSAKEQDEETGLHYFSARYYDSRTSVWLSVDPLAEKYPNISSYVYCANNPVKYVDPDGRDWFVNGSNGNVVFLRGVNTITNTQRVKYGLGNYRYENLGKDNMFGKNLSEINGQNVLMFNGPYFSEKFMNKHGLVKAEVLSVSETKIENTDYGHIGIYNPEPITTTTVLQPEIYDSRLTFVSPNKLNTKSNVKRDIGESSFNSIETTSYDLIKPVNQNVNTTSVYSNDRVSIKWDNVSNGIQTLFDIAPYLLNLFKK